jgi:hypothetical protein
MTRLVTDPVIDGVLNFAKLIVNRLPSWMTAGAAARFGLGKGAENAATATATSSKIVSTVVLVLQGRYPHPLPGSHYSVIGFMWSVLASIGIKYREIAAKVTEFGMRDTTSSRAVAVALGLFDLDLALLLTAALGEQYLGSFGKTIADLVEQHGVIVKVSQFVRFRSAVLSDRLIFDIKAWILHVRRIARIPLEHGLFPRFLHSTALPFRHVALSVDSTVPQSHPQRLCTLAGWNDVHVSFRTIAVCPRRRSDARFPATGSLSLDSYQHVGRYVEKAPCM